VLVIYVWVLLISVIVAMFVTLCVLLWREK